MSIADKSKAEIIDALKVERAQYGLLKLRTDELEGENAELRKQLEAARTIIALSGESVSQPATITTAGSIPQEAASPAESAEPKNKNAVYSDEAE